MVVGFGGLETAATHASQGPAVSAGSVIPRRHLAEAYCGSGIGLPSRSASHPRMIRYRTQMPTPIMPA